MRTPHTELLGQLPLGRQPLPGMQTARVKLLLDILQDGVDLVVVRRLHGHNRIGMQRSKKNQSNQNIGRYLLLLFIKKARKGYVFIV